MLSINDAWLGKAEPHVCMDLLFPWTCAHACLVHGACVQGSCDYGCFAVQLVV